jgi:hypothetical protein
LRGGHKNTIEISANEIRKTIVNIQNELGRWWQMKLSTGSRSLMMPMEVDMETKMEE